MSTHEPIAIVGIGCRLPGGSNDPRSFWRLLESGTDAISDVPRDRWDADAIYHAERAAPGRTYARRGGFIEGVDRFDAHYFGISPREAASIDPQTRLLLEVAVEALEDGGQAPGARAASTGVFVGISGSDYQDMLLADRRIIDGYTTTGTAMSIAANRISHALDFHGPSIAIDTACSSSLVAVHLACQSLWHGESELALAGGACLLLRPEVTIGFSKGFMLSRDGRCKAFDARGDGFVRGEGAALVVLKPLARALADGDRIYCVVLATNVNQDGHTPTGIAVPNPRAQIASLESAYAKAGVDPQSVHYVEAHGPGTPVGDPIEMGALGHVLGVGRTAGSELLVGSVKTNIGHLEPAAGVAALIKAALCLRHGAIPPNLHFEEPNPAIDFTGLRVRVPTTLEAWTPSLERRVAGVNSFGFGGTNAHVVLAGAEHYTHDAIASSACDKEPGPVLVPLSAKCDGALRELAGSLQRQLEREPVSMPELASTLWHRRAHHEHRLGVVARSPAELCELLAAYRAGEARPSLSGAVAAPTRANVAFVFCGMGSHWWRMGRDLLRSERVFGTVLEELDAIFARYADWSLVAELSAEEHRSRIARFDIAQPAMFAVQVGLARLWEHFGIQPAAIVGHSVGEAAAAHIAGSLSLEDAASVVIHRSRLQVTTQGKGRLLAIGLSEAEIAPLLAQHAAVVSVAAVNSPGSVTLAGDPAALDAIVATLEPSAVFCRFLRADVPAHSPQMEPLKPELVASLSDISPRDASLPLYSTVRGARIVGREQDGVYWGDNLRQPVRFAAAISAMFEDGIGGFIECSPHPVLSQSILETARARSRSAFVVGSLRRNEPDRASLLTAAADLWSRGCTLDPRALGVELLRPLELPRYPFQRERHWLEPTCSERARLPRFEGPLLGSRTDEALPTWELRIDEHNHGYLYDHDVQGAVIFPAAGFVEMALEAAKALHGDGPALVEDVHLEKALFMPRNQTVLARLTLDPDSGRFRVFGRVDAVEPQPWLQCCHGRVRRWHDDGETRALDLSSIERRCANPLEHEAFYAKLGRMGDAFGPTFRGLVGGACGDHEALAVIEPHALVRPALAAHRVHPVVLDACFQSLIANLPASAEGSALPVKLEELRFYASPRGERLYCHARSSVYEGAGFGGELTLCDAEGRVLLEARGFAFRSLERRAPERSVAERGLVHGLRWEHLPVAGATVATPSLPTPSQTAAMLAPIATELSRNLDRAAHYRCARPALERIALAFMSRAIETLAPDVALECGAPAEPRQLARTAGVATGLIRAFERIVHTLVGTRALVVRAGRLRAPVPAEDPQVLIQQLAPRLASYDAELSLLERVGPQLAAVLRGELDPLPLVFPEGDLDEVARLYECAPTAHLYNRLVAHAVAHAAHALPAGHRLHVLEVGAGTGGTASHVLAAVPSERLEYLFTDVSPAFTARAEREFAARELRTGVLDLERDLAEQGYENGSFEVVLAADVLHATRDLPACLARLEQLLVPGGQLILLELANAPCWVDVTFGLLPGWWRFEDARRAAASWPLHTPAQWREVLLETGFSDVCCVADEEAEQCVLLAACSRSVAIERAHVPSGDGTWLLVDDAGGVADALAERLVASGRSVVRCRAAGDARALSTALARVSHDLEGVVALHALDLESSDHTPATLERAPAAGPGALVQLVQSLNARTWRRPPRLWAVTRCAERVDGSEPRIAALQASIWGVVRVLANEHAELRPSMVDLGECSAAELDALAFELAHDGIEDAIALRAGERYVQRWRTSTLSRGRGQLPKHSRCSVASDGTTTVTDQPAPGRGEVRLAVRAAGGTLPAAAGVIEAVGDGVSHLLPGQTAVALIPDAHCSHAIVPASRVAAAALEQSFEEVASAAGAAWIASRVLHEVARVRAGETLFVHGAGNEIGLACVRLARAAGARVLASAPSSASAARLRREGVDSCAASSLDLPAWVRERTAGRGADVVLVAASPAGTRVGPQLLATLGRLVDLSGAIWSELPRGRSVIALDFDALREAEPSIDRWLEAMRSVGGLPHRVYPLAESARARSQRVDSHEPAVVVSMLDACIERPGPRASELVLSADRSYLVSGGLGGFGLELSRWLARRGARHLVLLGRSGDARPEARAAVAELRAAGVEVSVHAADAASARDLQRVFAQLDAQMPPLAGIVHAAMVLQDAVVDKLELEQLAQVWRPKVDGAFELHRASAGRALDFFVAFSSFAGLVGNPGQAAYAAANASLDALMHERRRSGLPGLSVNWGSIGSVGYVAQNQAVADHLSGLGLEPIEIETALAGLAELIAYGSAQAAVISVDFRKWCAAHPAGRTPRFVHLASSESTARSPSESVTSAEGLRSALRPLSRDERRSELVARTRTGVARSLRIPADKLEIDRSLVDLGFDSLMAIELRSRLREETGVDIPTMKLMGGPDITQLAEFLLDAIFPSDAPPAPIAVERPGAAASGAGVWFRRASAQPGPRQRLFCFPYNGGTGATYAAWEKSLDGTEVVSVRLPGQLDRLAEPAPSDVAMLVVEIANELQAARLLDLPFAFYGHSLGALVAYELARELQRRGLAAPEQLLVGAFQAPHLPNPFPAHDRLTDAHSLARLGMLEDLASVLEDREYLEAIGSVVAAGMRWIEGYRHHPEPKLSCAITALGGTRDAVVSAEQLRGWSHHTTGAFVQEALEGSHLFVESGRAAVLEIVGRTFEQPQAIARAS